jgi:hypothetical protein
METWKISSVGKATSKKQTSKTAKRDDNASFSSRHIPAADRIILRLSGRFATFFSSRVENSKGHSSNYRRAAKNANPRLPSIGTNTWGAR